MPSLGPASDNPLSWLPDHTQGPKGIADLGEVGEDAREERRGLRRGGGVWGRGATRAAVARRGRRRGVGVGWVKEWVQEA
jgi:hypothetical protein